MNKPILAIVVPCYNEEAVLPQMSTVFIKKVEDLIARGAIDVRSFILFCDDGSTDRTWRIISDLSVGNPIIKGISLSRNRGHQNALLAGLMSAYRQADAVVSLDCDGQDDINAIDEMLHKYTDGADVVYGVRNRRVSDTWFKRVTAESFYKLMVWLGADVVYNHADYRLLSKRVLESFSKYGEVNLFLRGLFPLVGYRSDVVYYERHERMGGESHYPFLKMLGFAWDGITSLSIKPIRIISILGVIMAFCGMTMVGWCFYSYFSGLAVPGWASNVIMCSMIGGVQLISLGVIGEYVGKIYLETKRRPRFAIGDTVGDISAISDCCMD